MYISKYQHDGKNNSFKNIKLKRTKAVQTTKKTHFTKILHCIIRIQARHRKQSNPITLNSLYFKYTISGINILCIYMYHVTQL